MECRESGKREGASPWLESSGGGAADRRIRRYCSTVGGSESRLPCQRFCSVAACRNPFNGSDRSSSSPAADVAMFGWINKGTKSAGVFGDRCVSAAGFLPPNQPASDTPNALR